MNRREAMYRVAGLMGASFTAPLLLGLSNLEARDKEEIPFIAIPESQRKLIEEIAELIIPETSTPGAKAAGVPDFMIMMLEECYTKEDRERFYRGLEELNTKAKSEFKKAFLDGTKEQQMQLLLSEEKLAHQAKDKDKEVPFIKMMKELTVFGYFTSEIGSTQALEYLPIPGRFDACITIDKKQKLSTF